jgi:hypothetical protein
MHATRQRIKGALLASLAGSLFVMAAHAHATDASPGDVQQIRELFLRQTAAESAHDIAALDSVIARAPAGQPDPVSFIARAYQFIGRDAVMAHFREAFEGTWRLDTDESAIRIVPLGADIVQIYAPTLVTIGAPGKEAKTAPFLINEFAIRTPDGWRISAIVPIPAQ